MLCSSMGAGGHTGQAGCRATEPADGQKFGGQSVIQGRAQPDWAYEFPVWIGPDTQICRTGPAGWD